MRGAVNFDIAIEEADSVRLSLLIHNVIEGSNGRDPFIARGALSGLWLLECKQVVDIDCAFVA